MQQITSRVTSGVSCFGLMQAVLEKLQEVFSTHLKALCVTQLQSSLLFLQWWQFSTSVIEHHEKVVDSYR